MNQKDFNLLINDISNILKPLNQLLYECLVLIIFYYIFNTISFLNHNSKIHKPFVYLVFIICICLDWIIWNNCNQSSLFIAILFIYIVFQIILKIFNHLEAVILAELITNKYIWKYQMN